MASYSYEIICLANSRKVSGRCVAGMIVGGKDKHSWLRPISDRPSGEISEFERRYQDGTKAQVLDKIKIFYKKPEPDGFQIENHLIESGFYWEKIGSVSTQFVSKLPKLNSGPLWKNGASTYHGINDKVSEEDCKKLKGSITLISPENLVVHVQQEDNPFSGISKKTVRGHFQFSGVKYILKITDPRAEIHFLSRGVGEYSIVC